MCSARVHVNINPLRLRPVSRARPDPSIYLLHSIVSDTITLQSQILIELLVLRLLSQYDSSTCTPHRQRRLKDTSPYLSFAHHGQRGTREPFIPRGVLSPTRQLDSKWQTISWYTPRREIYHSTSTWLPPGMYYVSTEEDWVDLFRP